MRQLVAMFFKNGCFNKYVFHNCRMFPWQLFNRNLVGKLTGLIRTETILSPQPQKILIFVWKVSRVHAVRPRANLVPMKKIIRYYTGRKSVVVRCFVSWIGIVVSEKWRNVKVLGKKTNMVELDALCFQSRAVPIFWTLFPFWNGFETSRYQTFCGISNYFSLSLSWWISILFLEYLVSTSKNTCVQMLKISIFLNASILLFSANLLEVLIFDSWYGLSTIIAHLLNHFISCRKHESPFSVQLS